MKTIYLEKKQVPANLQNLFGYRGNKFQCVVTDSVGISNTQWNGGSRSSYMLINLSTMQTKQIVDNRPFPHNQDAMPDVTLEPNTMVVKHIMFQGKDLGLRFYVHPDNKINFLPDQSADKLTRNDKIVLQFTRSLKFSYGIKNYRYHEASRCYKDLTLEDWNEAKQRMIDAGYLRKNGAITPAGRNVDCSEIKTNSWS